jgi:hypothetical protein
VELRVGMGEQVQARPVVLLWVLLWLMDLLPVEV